MGEVITLLEACQAMIAETSAARGDGTKSRPTLLVFDEANLKRAAPATPGSEAGVLARRDLALGADLGVGARPESRRPHHGRASGERGDASADSPPCQRARDRRCLRGG